MYGTLPSPVTHAPPCADVRRPFGLDDLLISGGDVRLAVDPKTGLNGYGCQPCPRPAAISLSSSTASTISVRAYHAADSMLARLEAAGGREAACTEAFEEVRATIAAQLELPSHVDVVLARSGTDAVVHALFLSRCLLRKPVVSVVVAADETGSGVPLAAAGRHFAAACGRAKGEAIAGLQSAIACVTTRDESGRPRSEPEIDAQVHARVSQAVAEGFGVALHMMDHSKLGTRAPSLSLVHQLLHEHSGAVSVFVDACQMRVSRARLNWFLDQGFVVLITGSKFFCGPAF